MIVRRVFAGLALLLLAAAVMRHASVAAWSGSDPGAAARWWPGHPAAEMALAETAIGEAAAKGQAPGREVFGRLAFVAQRAPMEVSPLMAHGVAALQAGQAQRAQRLFLLAERRRPREYAPHYFLADSYLRAGRVEPGLRELVNLARLAPNGITSAAPFVADYARTPANWPQMRRIFEREPILGRAVLAALARDPANVQALLALAGREDRSPDSAWVTTSLAAHVEAGRFAEGRRLWALLSGIRAGENALVHDPEFRDTRSPPPFNWALAESAVGSAERRSGGGLQVVFHGSQSGNLARQLLLLGPGRYRLVIASEGKLAEPQALAWNLDCARPARDLAQVPVRTSGQSASEFVVPPGCPAQWLSLDARAQDIRGDSDIRIAFVRIERTGG